ncbi:zf-HC2 domain-containing protein [Paenibacillus sp. KQZ6P-2]|uniref:Anti-sigma-W factor RsiW n=1 Tax=Paenibacillus mangrovi TaxID=2931978 RepID=A0A9X2B2X8_9BACL|nr:zf-HC2 domain-containing protein [Paenibacillus mangrovi]MCJ8012989.1 zf-HC2 domain-containing protein [Paenibacillus mangrovi]
MIKIKCEIINDLLPLYIDNVCSEESRRLVEEHLASCSSCTYEAQKFQSEIALSRVNFVNNQSEVKVLQSISNFWNKTRTKAFMKGLLVASLLFVIFILGYIGLFRWNIIPVPMNVVEIKDVSQLADGRIAYHVQLTDGYDLNVIKHKLDEDGNMYIMPYRTIIKKKPITDVGLHNMYYLSDPAENNAWQAKWGDNIEMRALYFGTKDDNILIWKKGMNLPAASKQIEDNYNMSN